MRKRPRRVAAALTALMMCLVATPCSSQELADPEDRMDDAGPSRDTWYIGFSFGSGPASLTLGDESQSYGEIFDDFEQASPFDSRLRLSVGFEVGATINHQLLLGFKLAGMREQGETSNDDFEYSAGLQHSQYLLCATYFPTPNGQGLFVRAGAGAAAVSLEQSLEIRGIKRETFVDETGFGGMLGLGYALWLGDSFNLVLANDFHYASFGGDARRNEPTSGWFNDITLGFMWY